MTQALALGEWAPSPYCGRLDPHDPHPWRVGGRGPYSCPGPPTTTRAERELVERGLEAAR